MVSSLLFTFMGCQIYNNNLKVSTFVGKITSGGIVSAPLKNQNVSGYYDSDIPTSDSADNPNGISAFGSTHEFAEVANPDFIVNDARMPAFWNFTWDTSNDQCVDQYSGAPISSPENFYNVPILPEQNYVSIFQPIYDFFSGSSSEPQEVLTCYQNDVNKPDFVPSDVYPQVALDTALPSTIQVHSFTPINAAAASTQLNVYDSSFANPATLTAETVASNGGYATFPYPAALPAGAYITTITTGNGANLKTVGMEPFFIAHNDTSFTSAFGVDEAAPEVITTASS